MRTQALLRDKNLMWGANQSPGMNDENDDENERVAKETYDMLNDLLKANKE